MSARLPVGAKLLLARAMLIQVGGELATSASEIQTKG